MIFQLANVLLQEGGRKLPAYQTEIIAEEKDAVVVTASGIRLLADISGGRRLQ
ncbi:MAG: hypothetical protein Q7U64_02960 [Desulfocapsaceae bacterium]|nr:hypothetical protein [Desulfocapsaceae bacterium]